MVAADRSRTVAATLCTAALALALVSAPVSAEHSPRVVFRIASPDITESSSLVVSTVESGLVYTANDSGDTATVYVLAARSGAVVGRAQLTGVTPLDIEALSAGSDGALVVADIGDNGADRTSVALYKIPQPGRGPGEVAADRVALRYSDGPRDAEAIVYDAASGRVFVVGKEFSGAHVYRTPPDVFSRSRAVLRPVADAPLFATDATLLPGGDLAVIRTYFDAVVYRYPGWVKVQSFVLPRQPQGESVAAPARGGHLWIGSEGQNSAVLSVPLPLIEPVEATATPTGVPSPTTASQASPHHELLKSATRVVIVVAVGALALVVALVGVLYRRHRRAA